MGQLATCLLCKSEELSSEMTYHMTGKSDKTQLQPKHSKALGTEAGGPLSSLAIWST